MGARLKLLFPPIERPLVELDDLVGFVAPGFETTVVDEFRERYAGLFRDQLDRLRKSDALHLHHKVEYRAALVTTKTIEDLFNGTDGKRRGLLFVKRTTGHPVGALLLELDVILHHADDVRLAF